MINSRFGAAQHELNVISSMLRDRWVAYHQFVDRSGGEPRYWLHADHFQARWLAEVYEALVDGGLTEIEQRLRAYPATDPAHVAANVVVERIAGHYRRLAESGVPGARQALADSDRWASLHHCIRQLAQPTWPSDTRKARHDAYVTVRAAQRPSTIPEVPFQPASGRVGDAESFYREFAVILAVLNDAARARRFRYTPSSPDASPYWLQPQDFGHRLTTEIWDALVTGPDPAIALPAATDPTLTPQQRTQAMIEHIEHRLRCIDYHRSTPDPEGFNQALARQLAKWSNEDFSPNPDNAPLYAVHSILEPSIPATVSALAGGVLHAGTADASLADIAIDLSIRKQALDELAERLDHAPRTTAGYSTTLAPAADPVPDSETAPSYADRHTERKVLLSLIQNPRQLHRPGPVKSLQQQDFTQPEHAYVFKAIQSLPPDAVTDHWIVAAQARRLAGYDRAPALNSDELDTIVLAARTQTMPPADVGAAHLTLMTVRRTTRNASTAMTTAAKDTDLDPRRLITYGRDQVQQATDEALRHHERSTPRPTTRHPRV